jgi:hypothetical protein
VSVLDALSLSRPAALRPGLVVYTGARVLSLPRLIATLVLIALALLSKETAISSVLLLPATDWAFFRTQRGK